MFHGGGDALGSVLPRVFGTIEVRAAFVGRAIFAGRIVARAIRLGFRFAIAIAIGRLFGIACIACCKAPQMRLRAYSAPSLVSPGRGPHSSTAMHSAAISQAKSQRAWFCPGLAKGCRNKQCSSVCT